jgi:hypothetical protein
MSSNSQSVGTSNTIKSYKQRKWFIDYSKKSGSLSLTTTASSSSSSSDANNNSSVAPIGYTDRTIADVANTEESTRLIGMRSWDIALGPLKQAPMNVMISWMAGNSIALFPIMFVGMLLFRPFQSMFTISKAFEAIESGQYSLLQKLIYVLGNLVNLAIALYKCHSMGLLPTYASDWLAFANPQERMEYSFGGFSLV